MFVGESNEILKYRKTNTWMKLKVIHHVGGWAYNGVRIGTIRGTESI